MFYFERVVLTLWIGGMWVIGFIVAPVLFSSIDDRMLAGNIAGQLFSIVSYVGISSASLLIVFSVYRSGTAAFAHWPFRILLLMLLITLGAQFGITPMMQAIKAEVGTAIQQGTEAHGRFAMLHGISSILFIINSVLGLLLVVRGVMPGHSNVNAAE
jgi:uncharacterized membrane protein